MDCRTVIFIQAVKFFKNIFDENLPTKIPWIILSMSGKPDRHNYECRMVYGELCKREDRGEERVVCVGLLSSSFLSLSLSLSLPYLNLLSKGRKRRELITHLLSFLSSWDITREKKRGEERSEKPHTWKKLFLSHTPKRIQQPLPQFSFAHRRERRRKHTPESSLDERECKGET